MKRVHTSESDSPVVYSSSMYTGESESHLPPKKRTYVPPTEVIDLVSDSEEEEEEPKKPRYWTQREDNLLADAMIRGEIPDVPHRTLGACKTRWLRLGKPGPIFSSFAPWTPEEDAKILTFGTDIELPGRSYAAIGKRQTFLSRKE